MLVSGRADLIASMSQCHDGTGIVRKIIDIDAHVSLWSNNIELITFISIFVVNPFKHMESVTE